MAAKKKAKKTPQKKTEIAQKKPRGHNLKGRPKGIKNKTTLFKEAMKEGFENLLEKEAQKVFMAVVSEAKTGNMQAAKMILDRVIPVTKAIDLGAGDLGKGGITINIESLTASVGEADSGEIIDITDAEYTEE